MASYADVASKGPKQSDAEKVPDAVPEIAHPDSGVHTLNGLSINQPNPVPSYADQQLAHERAEHEAEEAKHEADKVAAKVREFEAMSEKELTKLEKEGGQQWEDFKKYSTKKYKEFKKEAGAEAEKLKKSANRGEKWVQKNKTHPVVLGNAVVVSLVTGFLGFRVYHLHKTGGLNWNIGAAVVGGLTAFAMGDWLFTRYMFQRYPPK